MKYHLAIDESLGYIGPFRNKATLVESPEDCAELHELPGVDQLEHRIKGTPILIHDYHPQPYDESGFPFGMTAYYIKEVYDPVRGRYGAAISRSFVGGRPEFSIEVSGVSPTREEAVTELRDMAKEMGGRQLDPGRSHNKGQTTLP
jgi:hypothetical protein